MDISFGLSGDSSNFEADNTVLDALLKLGDTLNPNILEGVLKASLKVWDKLCYRATVQNRPTTFS